MWVANFNAPAALTHRKESPVPIVQVTVCSPELVWTLVRTNIYLPVPGIEGRFVQPVA
jgi:hypothetical protein